MTAPQLLERIITSFGESKPAIRGHRLTVEEVLGELSLENDPQTLLKQYPGLEIEDI